MKTIFEKFIVRFSMILACVGMLVGINSCVEEDMPYIVLDQEEIEVGTEAEKYTIDVKSNLSWTAACDQDWIQLYNPKGQYKGNFAFAVAANGTTQERTAVITVTSADGSIQATVMVRQSPKDAELFLTKEKAYFNKEASSQKVRVVSNHDWKVLSSEEWCTVTPAEGAASAEFEINVEENLSGAIRRATVSVICEINVEEPIIRTVEVIQEGTKFFFAVPTDKFYLSSAIEEDGRPLYIPYETSDENVEIRLSADVDWIIIERMEPMSAETKSVVRQEVSLFIEANPTGAERTGKVTLTVLSEGQEPIMKTVTIVQSGEDFFFVIPTKEYNVANGGDSLYVDYKIGGANLTITHNSDVKWIEIKEETDPNTSEVIYKLMVAENYTDMDRTGKVTFSASNNGGEPVMETIVVNQTCKDFYFAVPVKKYEVEQNGQYIEAKYQVSGQNVNVEVEASAEWIVAEKNPDGDSEIFIKIDPNTDTDTRNGQVILSASNNGGRPINEIIEISQEGTKLNIPVQEVLLEGEGTETFVTFDTNTILELQTSYAWLHAEIVEGQNTIRIWAEQNITGQQRIGQVSIIGKADENAAGGDRLIQIVKVSQNSLPVYFEFAQDTYTYSYHETTTLVALKSTGAWKLDPSIKLPEWLNVTPAEGEGDATISISLNANKFMMERKLQLVFQNTTLNKTCILNIVQEGDPAGLKDFSHLGKGYDASGKYAYDEDVRAAVLSWQKLYLGNHIADIINTNNTTEQNISGRTRDEYVKEYTVSAGVAGSYSGFTAGVSTNFSESSLSSSEHSFGTFRHMTKKQIIKLYDNVTAQQTMDCRSDMFIADIERLSAQDLVTKYGTHVIMGLSLGGVLEYSMTANTYVTGKSVDWGLAVEAGFEMAGYGASASSGYQDFQSMQKEEAQFESKLVCRGGESQFASTGVPGGDGKSTYNQWLSSLTDQNKWVMVDYEGKKLIPLWEFIEDPQKAQAVEEYAQAVLSGQGLPGIQSNNKNLFVEVVRTESKLEDTDTEYETEYNWELKTLVNDEQERSLWRTVGYDKGQYEVLKWDSDQRTFISHRTVGIAQPYNIPAMTHHTLTVKGTGIKEIDTKDSGADEFYDFSVSFEFNPLRNTWTDKATGVEYPNDGREIKVSTYTKEYNSAWSLDFYIKIHF